MSVVIGVKFKDNGKVYYFDPKNINFNEGDGVVVETAKGVEYGFVAFANKNVDSSTINGELKPVIRKATANDDQQYRNNINRRHESIRKAQELADKRNLDMKVVSAEFSFDGNKVTFCFTSDNRVDFRELVKDLASQFHARIELRQIGIRDECKMKGGLGPCGRVCCCNGYMNDFAHTSIKMAKNQGLSLNPTKISGLCGRLMCCLKFEDEYYAETLKFMPKVNSEIDTPNGRGKVDSLDVLHQRVKVRITGADDITELYEFDLQQLGIEPIYSTAPFEDDDSDDDSDILPDVPQE